MLPVLLGQAELTPRKTSCATPQIERAWSKAYADEAEGIIEVKVAPGKVGITLSRFGEVYKVYDQDGVLGRAGVGRGWKLASIDGVSYTRALLEQKLSGNLTYVLTFHRMTTYVMEICLDAEFFELSNFVKRQCLQYKDLYWFQLKTDNIHKVMPTGRLRQYEKQARACHGDHFHRLFHWSAREDLDDIVRGGFQFDANAVADFSTHTFAKHPQHLLMDNSVAGMRGADSTCVRSSLNNGLWGCCIGAVCAVITGSSVGVCIGACAGGGCVGACGGAARGIYARTQTLRMLLCDVYLGETDKGINVNFMPRRQYDSTATG